MAKQYSQENELVLNEDKTQQLILGPGQANAYELYLVLATHEVNYLGMTLDSDLKWKPHLDKLCNKLSTVLYVIKRLTNVSNT